MKGEIIPIRETKIINGEKFVHKYSINGMKIGCGGVLYDDAWDLEYLNLEYTETDIPIEPVEPTDEAKQKAETDLTISDTLEMLGELGVDVSD